MKADARFYPLDRAQGYLDSLALADMTRLDLEPGQRGCIVYSSDLPVGVLVVTQTPGSDGFGR